MTEESLPTVMFLTALDLEYEAVLACLNERQEWPNLLKEKRGKRYRYGDYVTKGGRSWQVVLRQQADAGNQIALSEGISAINYFKPDYLFFVGIAAKMKEVELGDVVVSTLVRNYEFGKMVGEEHQPRPRQESASRDLVELARDLAKQSPWKQSPKVVVGVILSGEKVIDSKPYMEKLKRNYSDAVALEMEGFGFLQAVNQEEHQGIVVRGISDAGMNKAETDSQGDWRSKAAQNAAAFAFAMLEELPSPETKSNLVSPSVIVEKKENKPKPPPQSPSISSGKIVEVAFDVVTVDQRGRIINERRTNRQLSFELGNGVQLELMYIPAGEFMMGSPATEKGRGDYEGPQHKVKIASPFWMGKYPITQAQYEAIMGENPSYFKGAQRPVESVSWDDCNEFRKRLSERLGVEFKLPSEAQWEYACRAGTTTAYSFGDDASQLENYAWYNKNSGGKTHPVGEKQPNGFGLYDMHGNVWEWCEDLWHENYEGAPADGSAWISGGTPNAHLLRGGSWGDNVNRLRCAYRSGLNTTYRFNFGGLRLSRM